MQKLIEGLLIAALVFTIPLAGADDDKSEKEFYA